MIENQKISSAKKWHQTCGVALVLCSFAVLLLSAFPVQAQDCSNPNGIRGDMLFNGTSDVFQACTARGWMAFHPPDPCTTSSTPGTACADGQTVYAGSWSGSRYYTTTADQSTSARWGAYGVTLGVNAQSTADGLTNTNTALASIEGNPQAGGCSAAPYNPPACAPNAHVLCKDLRTTLGGNWYLPAEDEIINVLYTNKAAIGGFSNVFYWASAEGSINAARVVSLLDGSRSFSNKSGLFTMRCVRRE